MIIVDDQPEIIEIIEEFITSQLEVDFDTAQNGQEALNLISKNIYNVIITDHHMPGMSGTDVLREIRATEGPNQHCPVVFVTAMESEVLREINGKYQKVYVLDKVVEIQKLIDVINECLS
jgi:CheY-like chemotaxis protein